MNRRLHPDPTVVTIWTIYDHPKDRPDCYVARKFEVDAGGPHPTDVTFEHADLDWLREMMPRVGMSVCLGRQDGDEAQIVESWI